MRLNGVVVNRFVSTSAARQSLGRGFVGLQNHSDADRVSFRSVQVKEWGNERPRCAGTARRAPSDAFSGARLDGCRWNRIVRYDGGGLDVSGGKLHLELTGGDILGRSNTGPANLVLQRAPVRRVDDRDDRARPAPLGLAAGGPAGLPRRRRLRQARRRGGRRPGPAPARQRGRGRRRRECSGGDDAAAAERHLPAAPREVGLALHGLVEPRTDGAGGVSAPSSTGGSLQGRPTASSRSGRAGSGAPPYAAFERFRWARSG